MSFIQSRVNTSSLQANLDLYNKYIELYDTKSSYKHGPHLIFFRQFFFFFLDIDPIHFEQLMNNLSKDFFIFFDNLYSSIGRKSPPHIDLQCTDDVTVFFTKAHEKDPIFFGCLHMLIKRLNQVDFSVVRDGGEYYNHFWWPHSREHRCFVSPIFKPQSDVQDNSFVYFKKFFIEFTAFQSQMGKISYMEWQEVFDTFHATFDDVHFLNLMEMTDEYFNKIELSNIANFTEKEDEED